MSNPLITFKFNSNFIHDKWRPRKPGAGDPKGAKRAKSEIQTKENKTHKTNTKITIEDISSEPISDPTAQYNLIQQIIQADISDPLLLGKLLVREIIFGCSNSQHKQ